MKKYLNIILQIIEVLLLSAVVIILFANVPVKIINLGGRTSGENSAQEELVLWDGNHNGASFSVNVSGDTIIVSGDPGEIYATLSVGDVVSFHTTSTSFDGDIIEVNDPYYVVSASDDRFEIASTSGGTSIDFASTASEGNGSDQLFTEEIAETGEFDCGGFEYIDFTLAGEELPSIGFYFLVSNMETQPDWYAIRSTTNRYEYAAVFDIEGNTELEGDVGLEESANFFEMYELYLHNARWCMVISDNYASGSVDIRGKGF